MEISDTCTAPDSEAQQTAAPGRGTVGVSRAIKKKEGFLYPELVSSGSLLEKPTLGPHLSDPLNYEFWDKTKNLLNKPSRVF